MKLLLANILLILGFYQTAFAQNAGCSLIDKSRDLLFITYERMDDPDLKRQGIDRDRILVRLHNNSTCPIVIQTTDAEKFFIPKPPNLSVIEKIKRPTEIRWDLSEGEIVPAVTFYIQDERRSKVPKATWGGDVFYGFHVLGGRTILFPIPLAYLRKGNDIIVPFNFAWEDERGKPAPKMIFSGDVKHLVYFYKSHVPADVLRKSGRR
jgi:hypothetical protein